MRAWPWPWACTFLVLLFARDAFAERVRVGAFSFDLDTRRVCVVAPEGHRTDSACAGVDTSPMLDADGQAITYDFLALMPGTHRYWLTIIQFPALPQAADMKQALRELISSDRRWEVQGPGSTSTTTVAGDLSRATFDFDVTAKGAPYAVSCIVFPQAKSYVIETLTSKEYERETAASVRELLATWGVNEAPPSSEAPFVTWLVLHRAWLFGAFAVVLGLVVRDARARRQKKPRRDAAALDLPKYASARRVGAIAALTTSASVIAELLGYAFPSSALWFRGLGALLSYASLGPLLLWVHRVTVNARVLGCADIPTATKAVTWFFVPVASVFMPYRAVADVAASMRGPGRMDAVWRVALWWMPMVAMLGAQFFRWSVAKTLFAAMVSLAAWSMVVAIDQGQARMFRNAIKAR